MSKIKNCPCCNHHDMYEITQTDDMGAEIPALFCNACKMIFTVENDSPYMSDEKTFEYLKEKLHEKFNQRTILETIVEKFNQRKEYWESDDVKDRKSAEKHIGTWRSATLIVKGEGDLE